MARDYKREYKKTHSSKKAKTDRAKRNSARRKMEKEGRVSKGDGKDVDHSVPLRKNGSNKKSNLRVVDKSVNRRKNGNAGGRPKGGRRKS